MLYDCTHKSNSNYLMIHLVLLDAPERLTNAINRKN